MNFITIFHKEGEITIPVDCIYHIEKENAHDLQMNGGESDGTIISISDRFYAQIKTYGLFSGEGKNKLLSLNEEQYILLLEKLKTCMEGQNER